MTDTTDMVERIFRMVNAIETMIADQAEVVAKLQAIPGPWTQIQWRTFKMQMYVLTGMQLAYVPVLISLPATQVGTTEEQKNG